MKFGILKYLGVCAAALVIASPASASLSVSLGVDNFAKTLKVSFSGHTDPITAYDLFINYNLLGVGDITSVDSNNKLGDTGLLEALFASDFSTSGLIRGQETSFLSNADVAALQTLDPVWLFTVQFASTVDISGVSFAVSTNGLSNAACGNDPTTGTYKCFPANQAPEPASMALVALALAGAGAAGKRRRSA